jgi:hypothetical protein
VGGDLGRAHDAAFGSGRFEGDAEIMVQAAASRSG